MAEGVREDLNLIVATALSLKSGDTCFVGIGIPSLAATLTSCGQLLEQGWGHPLRGTGTADVRRACACSPSDIESRTVTVCR